jgi:hypothetical protein
MLPVKEMRQFLFLSPLHWRSSPRTKQFIFVGHKFKSSDARVATDSGAASRTTGRRFGLTIFNVGRPATTGPAVTFMDVDASAT